MIAPELNIAELPLTGSFLVLRMVSSPNDIKQNIEKTLNNTHATTQKLTNNGFHNTKKHPINGTPSDQKKRPLIKEMITKIMHVYVHDQGKNFFNGGGPLIEVIITKILWAFCRLGPEVLP